MTSEEFLKQNKANMFTCRHYKNHCLMTYADCVLRQDAVKKSVHPTPGFVQSSGWKELYDYTPCLKCQEGRENKKIAKGKNMKTGASKTCPCGEVFYRRAGMRNVAWARAKYCEKHSLMACYTRKKDIEKILAERQTENKIDILKAVLEESTDMKHDAKEVFTPEIETNKDRAIHVPEPEIKTVNFAIKNESEFLPEDEGVTWKKCVECEAPFPRGDTIDSTWEKKLYCGPDCRKKVENRAKARRKVETRKARRDNFTPAKAQEVARVKWDSLSELLSAYVRDPEALNSIRAAAIKIGADCYQQAIQDTGGAM